MVQDPVSLSNLGFLPSGLLLAMFCILQTSMKSLIELIALVFLLQVNPASIRRRLILFIPLFLGLGAFYPMGPAYLFFD